MNHYRGKPLIITVALVMATASSRASLNSQSLKTPRVKTLFEQLMRASKNHLQAFKTQLSKY